MEFALTDEQLMIQETAAGFLSNVSTSEAIREVMKTELGYDAAVWNQICSELFLHAITIPEQYGGMGLGYVELAAVMEQMGRYVFCAPYFSTVCLATNALLVAGTDQQKEAYLPQIIEGKTATLAFTDASGQWSANGVSATYEKQGDNFVLNGTYRYVIDGHTADFLIVAAREKGSQGENGVSLFVVNADEAGVSREYLATMDQTRKQAQITLNNVELNADACMKNAGNAFAQLQTVLQLACVGLAAEQVGGAEQVLNITLEYMQERAQFGRTIASYQAVKHKAADMQLKVEVGRSAIYYAACVAQEALLIAQGEDGDANIASQLLEASSMAKAHCSDSYYYNAGTAIQLHGGVGFTWEYDVHLYFKRAKSSQLYLGDAVYHREQIAKQLLDNA